MQKLVAAALALYSCLTLSSVYDATEPQNEVNEFLYRVSNGKSAEKVTRLKLYVQNVVHGPNATLRVVAEASDTNTSATSFGRVGVMDDALTETPDPKSTVLGRYQGLSSSASIEESALLMAINFGFTSGKFNGSSLAMLGRNPLDDPLREMPIVGGTGVFRLARGFVITKTYRATTSTQNGVYEYNVFVIHY